MNQPEFTQEQIDRINSQKPKNGGGKGFTPSSSPSFDVKQQPQNDSSHTSPSDAEKATERFTRADRDFTSIELKQRRESDAAIVQDAMVEEIREQTLRREARNEMKRRMYSPEFREAVNQVAADELPVETDQEVKGLIDNAFAGLFEQSPAMKQLMGAAPKN